MAFPIEHLWMVVNRTKGPYCGGSTFTFKNSPRGGRPDDPAHRVFLLTRNRARHPFWGVAQKPLTKGLFLAPAIRLLPGDSEKSRSRSIGDRPS